MASPFPSNTQQSSEDLRTISAHLNGLIFNACVFARMRVWVSRSVALHGLNNVSYRQFETGLADAE